MHSCTFVAYAGRNAYIGGSIALQHVEEALLHTQK